MTTRVSELTVQELKGIVATVVRESTEDLIEDLLALNSPEYLKSIEEARKDFKEGRAKPLEGLFDV